MSVDEYLVRNECPICTTPVAESAQFVSSNPTAESLPFRAQGNFLSGYTSNRVFFSYNRCKCCNGLFCPIYFTQQQLNLLYAHQPENLIDVPLASRKATLHAYFDLLKRNSSLTGDYLELGPDIGVFAGICARNGHFSRFHLYEPNMEVHDILAKRLSDKQINITPNLYMQGLLTPSSLGLAVAIHVLDHLIDPVSMLRAIHRDLGPEGRLFLATHDESSWLAKVLGRRWPPYTLQHPQLFSQKSIQYLLERCGFKVLEIEKSINYFPVTLLMRASLNVMGIERWPSFMNWPWQLGLRLGNIATIAVKV